MRAECCERQRMAIVGVWQGAEWHHPREHAPVDGLLVPLREMLVDGIADGVDRVFALGRH
jgi:hypothetical protein